VCKTQYNRFSSFLYWAINRTYSLYINHGWWNGGGKLVAGNESLESTENTKTAIFGGPGKLIFRSSEMLHCVAECILK